MSGSDKQLVVVKKEEAGSHLLAFLLGGIVGAGIALLLAPQSGKETQQSIKDGARKFKEVTEVKVREAQKQITDSLGAARDGARETLGSVKDAVDAGRTAAGERLERGKEAYRAGVEAARDELARGVDGQEADGEGTEVDSDEGAAEGSGESSAASSKES